jgi:hypothetical protein
MKPIILSGGADGADSLFDKIGHMKGFKAIHHSFVGHNHKPLFGKVNKLSNDQIESAMHYVNIAAKRLNKNPPKDGYVKKLICRNWYQVAETGAVYAIAPVTEDLKNVDGGTGWAVAMAIESLDVPVFAYCYLTKSWYEFDRKQDRFASISNVPPIMETEYITGIGSRDITDECEEQVEKLLR